MNTNFFVAEDEVFNPNKVLTRKGMDTFIGERSIKSYAGVLKRDNKLFYNFIRVKVAEGKNCVDAIYARKAIVSNGCLQNDFFSFGEYNFVAFVTNGKIYCDLKNFFKERFGIESMSYEDVANQMHDEVENYIRETFTDCYVDTDVEEMGTAEAKYEFVFGRKHHMVTETRQLRDGEKLTEFYNRIDWKPLFEFVQRYYGIGVEQPPVPCLKPNGRIEVNWPENLRDKCGLFCHTYCEVYLQTFSSCCFHDITYDKDIVDKYLARPDFYRLNISLENDCNGTSSDAYLQLTFSLKHIEFSGGYNFANLFSAEYRKDTGWFVVSGEGEVLMGAKK